MSGKRSHVSKSNDEHPPRPVALLLAVVFAAAVSTWHWYRPLPKKAAVIASGPFVSVPESATSEESPRMKSKWKDSGLIFPSEDPNVEPQHSLASVSDDKAVCDVDPNSASALTGSGDLALQPFRETAQPLNRSISQIPPPMVPVRPGKSLSIPTPSEARLWTAVTKPLSESSAPVGEKFADTRLVSPGSSSDSASPFRVPRNREAPRPQEPVLSMKTDIWPDQGFDPRTSLAASQPKMAGIAPASSENSSEPKGMMSLSSNRIRTLDQEPEIRSTKPPNPLPSNDAKLSVSREASPRDAKNLIRQPTPKSPNTK